MLQRLGARRQRPPILKVSDQPLHERLVVNLGLLWVVARNDGLNWPHCDVADSS